MRVVAEDLPGVKLLELDPRHDERGFFARAFCSTALAALGVEGGVAQANMSFSAKRGTLRGLHYQLPPSAETKLVFCMRGRLYDLVLDLREDSPCFGRWTAAELSEDNRRLMVVPPGCAHGFLTLTDDVLAFYLVSNAYDASLERGVRWDDPVFGLRWPFEPLIVSERDSSHPSFDPGWHLPAAA